MKILLLGHSGYVGSVLYHYLLKFNYNLVGFDTSGPEKYLSSMDYSLLPKEYLKQFDVIIVLAGFSSVKQCLNNLSEAFDNNVTKLINLTDKLNENQKLIVASSSSVYGGLNRLDCLETIKEYNVINEYDLTKISIDQFLPLTKCNYYSLRFGTVAGCSPNLRTEIAINALVNSYMEKGYIEIFNGHTYRPILGIQDLVAGIKKIIDKEDSVRGIYNLASFNITFDELGDRVGEVLECPVKHVEKESTHLYNFSINCDKMKNSFGWEPRQTVESITRDLVYNWPSMHKGDRNEAYKFR